MKCSECLNTLGHLQVIRPLPRTELLLLCWLYCFWSLWHVYRSNNVKSVKEWVLTVYHTWTLYTLFMYNLLFKHAKIVLNTHTHTHSFSTYHMLMSENNTCISAFVAASSRPSVCLYCLYTCVCVYVWALGFSLADVSNQSLSRRSLSLYPLSVEPWVDWAGPVHPLVEQSWVVVLMMMAGMSRLWGAEH